MAELLSPPQSQSQSHGEGYHGKSPSKGGASAQARDEYVLTRLALGWTNEVLVRWPKATSLHSDFCNGERLIALAEALTDRPVVGIIPSPRLFLDRTANVRAALYHLERAWHITIVGISPEDCVRGNSSHLLQVLAFLATTVSPFHRFVDRFTKCKTIPVEITSLSASARQRTTSSKKLRRKTSEFAIAPLPPMVTPLAGETSRHQRTRSLARASAVFTFDAKAVEAAKQMQQPSTSRAPSLQCFTLDATSSQPPLQDVPNAAVDIPPPPVDDGTYIPPPPPVYDGTYIPPPPLTELTKAAAKAGVDFIPPPACPPPPLGSDGPILPPPIPPPEDYGDVDIPPPPLPTSPLVASTQVASSVVAATETRNARSESDEITIDPNSPTQSSDLGEKLDELVTELRLGGAKPITGKMDMTAAAETRSLTPTLSQSSTPSPPPMQLSSVTSPTITPTENGTTAPAIATPMAAAGTAVVTKPRRESCAGAAAKKRRRKVCRRKNLEELPPDFKETIGHAIAIDVSCNKLKSFPADVITHAPHVKELSIASNRISSIPAEVAGMTSLRILRLSVNCFTTIPQQVFRMPNLQELYCTGCGLTDVDIPADGVVAPIEVLDLSSNSLKELPDTIGRLTRLHMLNVDANQLEEFPDSLSFVETILEIRACENQIKRLDGNSWHWAKLDRLELYNNKLKSLPSTWFDGRNPAPRLMHLQLQKNQFEELPVSFFSALPGLVSLDLSENRLKWLPASIKAATCLESLYLGGNLLSELPAHVGELPSLVFIDVSRNRLRKIPDFAGCPRLSALTVGYNPIVALPQTLPQSINELHISGCGLKIFPSYRFPKLEAIMVANNELTFVDFTQMIDTNRIQYIDISHNKLAAIPMGMFSCREDNPLELDFSHNLFALSVNDSAFIRLQSCEPRLSVGISEMQGRRDSMEDVVVVLGDITGDGETDMLAVFDGHGGSDVATLASKSVTEYLRDNLSTPEDPESCIRVALKRANRMFESQTATTMQGTTVLIGVFTGAPRTLYCVNVGDSRAVMCRNGTAVRMSYDHKPLLPEEYARVTKAGGFVTEEGSIQGIVSVAHALGDYPLRPFVSDEPHCSKFVLEDTDEFVIFACDGLWDVISDSEAVRIARDALAKPDATPSTVALLLRDWAYLSGSSDNISVVIGIIHKPKPGL